MDAGEAASSLASLPPDQQPADGEALARELVKQKKLTKFQAEQLYAGKGKSLTLGNYVILDMLGQGGMGMVLKARHRRMDRVVALKVMSPAAVKSAEAVKRFHREAQAAAKLTHPNIVAAYDADEAQGTHFLVMQFVEGSDLSVLVKKNGPLPVEQAIQYILQAARGLEYAHAEGVIHRDIKPANLLIDAKGTVRILDMGLARIEGDTGAQAELTSTGAVMGTVDYMAPEQALNTKTADARSDIYSLGISLWYLLTGKPAYGGDSLMAKLLAHRDAPVPSLRSTRDTVPAAVDALFQKMVAKKAQNRYQTMTEVIRDLQGYLCAQPTITLPSAENTAEATMLLGDASKPADPQTLTSARSIGGGKPTAKLKPGRRQPFGGRTVGCKSGAEPLPCCCCWPSYSCDRGRMSGRKQGLTSFPTTRRKTCRRLQRDHPLSHPSGPIRHPTPRSSLIAKRRSGCCPSGAKSSFKFPTPRGKWSSMW